MGTAGFSIPYDTAQRAVDVNRVDRRRQLAQLRDTNGFRSYGNGETISDWNFRKKPNPVETWLLLFVRKITEYIVSMFTYIQVNDQYRRQYNSTRKI